MNESEVHELKKQLKQQQLNYDKDRAVYELKISQLTRRLEESELKYEAYKKSREMLVKIVDQMTESNFSKVYGRFNNGLTEVQTTNEQNTKRLMDTMNQVLTYVQVI